MGHKRKQLVDEGEAVLPPSKVRAVADEPPQTAAERRQQRSERKSKKPAHKKPTPQTQAQESKPDTLANGDDFVSIVERPKQEQVNGVKAKTNTKTKAKKLVAQRSQQEEGDRTLGDKSSAGSRFICFVGNLPFSATVEQVQDHFKKLEPTVRLSTDKKTGRGRGFAFLEFDSFDKIKTCLKIYHHSIFNPERDGVAEKDKKGGAERGRRINVELTAGGGGNTGQRKEKIIAKNKKLEEERERRRIEEVKQQAKQDKAKNQANPVPNDGRGDVHPSRLGRVHA